MKKMFYITLTALAATMTIMLSQLAIGQPCPAGAPCPRQQAAPSVTTAPCPCPASVPCPCQNPASSDQAIYDALNAQACFKTFSLLLQKADMATFLRGKGPYTVFAPTDEAFCKLPKGAVESLMCPENKCELEKFLRYHIVTKAVSCCEFTSAKKVRTAEGQCLLIEPAGNKLMINGCAEILKGDICTKNGKIYTIDTVLMP